MTHSIRLREPWQRLAAKELAENSTTHPADSLRFRRKFNTPTGLTTQQTVVLELTLVSPSRLLTIQLNEIELEPMLAVSHECADTVLRFNLREHLQAFNVLEIAFSGVESSLAQKFENHGAAQLLLGND